MLRACWVEWLGIVLRPEVLSLLQEQSTRLFTLERTNAVDSLRLDGGTVGSGNGSSNTNDTNDACSV